MGEKRFRHLVISLLLFVCLFFSFPVLAQSFPSPMNYAPNLWFSADEEYFPANPYDFFFKNGEEINGYDALKKYDALSIEEKLENLTVFYHVNDLGDEWVYQYWLLYVFNNSQGRIRNSHFGDWESVVVFVDKETKEVNRVIGTAHQRKLFDTEISHPGVNHVWSYVGLGSHANCVKGDANECGFFRWVAFETWRKDGSFPIRYPQYKLSEMDESFVEQFNGSNVLDKSPSLGISFPGIFHLNEFVYLPLGGQSPVYAWEQECFDEPDKLSPYALVNLGLIDRINKAKVQIANFVDGILDVFKGKEAIDQAGPIYGEEPKQISVLPLKNEASVLQAVVSDPAEHQVQVEKQIEEVEKNRIEYSEPIVRSESEDDLSVMMEDEKNEDDEVDEVVEEISDKPKINLGWGYNGTDPVSMVSQTSEESNIQNDRSEVVPVFESEPEEKVEDEDIVNPPVIISPINGISLGPLDDASTTNGFQVLARGMSDGDSVEIFVNSTSSDSAVVLVDNSNWEYLMNVDEGLNFLWFGSTNDGRRSPFVFLEIDIDTTPPLSVSDLSAESGSYRGSVDLLWTGFNDVGEYIVRCSTSTFFWDSSAEICRGNQEDCSNVSGLLPGQVYYFAIKSVDDLGNISDVSNVATASASAISDNIVISEIKNNYGEFVELYNPTSEDIDVSGWYFAYYSKERNWNKPYRSIKFPDDTIISSGNYYLIGLFSFPTAAIDVDWSPYKYNLLSNTNGSVAIFSSDPVKELEQDTLNDLVDAVGWGEVDFVYESQTIDGIIRNWSAKRRLSAWDTNNNLNDFLVDKFPNPANSLGDSVTLVHEDVVVSGEETWRAEYSPYILLASSGHSFVVDDSGVLNIEHGVSVRAMNSHIPLIVYGEINVTGEEDDFVTFASLGDEWAGIVLDNASASFNYVSFENGGSETKYKIAYDMKEMLRVIGGNVEISNSLFSSSSNNGVYFVDGATASVMNSSFVNYSENGIVIDGSEVDVNGCSFDGGKIGISIVNQSIGRISDNVFLRNKEEAIFLRSSFPVFNINEARENKINGILIYERSVFDRDAVWSGNMMYVPKSMNGSSPTVATGTTLTLEPGVVVKPSNKRSPLVVEGKLHINGSEDNRVVITSFYDGNYGDESGSVETDPDFGDYGKIIFAPGSTGILENILFRYADGLGFEGENVSVNNIIYEP